MKKAVKAILNVLSYGGIEVESARRLADIKKLDPIRIFLRKLDMEIYNGDYKVPIRLFFPDEKMEEHGAKEAILFFHGGGWTTESVETYDRVCARMAQSTGQIVVSVEYRLAPEHRFPTGLEDCYAAAQAMLRGEILLEVTPENVTIMGDSAGGNLAAAVCLMARRQKSAQKKPPPCGNLWITICRQPGSCSTLTVPLRTNQFKATISSEPRRKSRTHWIPSMPHSKSCLMICSRQRHGIFLLISLFCRRCWRRRD